MLKIKLCLLTCAFPFFVVTGGLADESPPNKCAANFCEAPTKGDATARKYYEDCILIQEEQCAARVISWSCPNPEKNGPACFETGKQALADEKCRLKSTTKATDCKPTDTKWNCTVATEDCRVFSNKNKVCPAGYSLQHITHPPNLKLFGVDGFCRDDHARIEQFKPSPKGSTKQPTE